MPRLCWIKMPWGQSVTWVISGILEVHYALCGLYSYVNGITGKSFSIRFQRGTICLGYVG